MTVTTIIGLEVHVQLQTQSKIFCGCAAAFNPTHPNVQTCPICLGLPGSLPVMNRDAFELAVKTAIALNCDIAPFTKWDRSEERRVGKERRSRWTTHPYKKKRKSTID